MIPQSCRLPVNIVRKIKHLRTLPARVSICACSGGPRNFMAGKALTPAREPAHETRRQTRPARGIVPVTEKQRRLDRLLDEALEETFPGSDAVAISQPA